MRPLARSLVLMLAIGCSVEADYNPIADAGDDQVVEPGELVTLSGRDSYDADGEVASYSWIVISGPDGSAAELSDATSASPEVTPDVEGTWVIGLTVTDDAGNSSDLDVVSVHALGGNDRPVAVLTADEDAQVGRAVDLDGSASSDADGDALTYSFEIVVAPRESAAAVEQDGSANATFTPDVLGYYVLGLTVSDGSTTSVRADVGIVAGEFSNAPPDVDCGEDQQIREGSDVTLDGTGSSDPDGDPLTYEWELVSVPDGSVAALDDATSATPMFNADTLGLYTAELRVSDGYVSSGLCTTNVIALENTPPDADAGDDVFASLAEEVTLDGTGSSDDDGDPLTYLWEVVSAPSGSAAGPLDATASITTISVDQVGTYEIRLTVDDGAAQDTDTMVITVEAGNTAPQADAGPDVSVELGVTASLDGSGSSDPDGDPLTYAWTLSSVPTGSGLTSADIVDAATATPSITPDVAGDYELTLTVDDGTATDSDVAIVTATDPGNTPPVADAGSDETYDEGETVELDGSGSSDADGDPLTYSWTFSSVPSGSALTDADITDASTDSASFVPDVAGEYEVWLTVSDGVETDTDEVLVTIREVTGNTPPVADAGDDIEASSGDTVTLDGSDSADADGDPLTYSWTFSSVPSGSALTDADLSDSTSDAPSFTPDVEGEYVLVLTVSDGTDTDADEVTVTVEDANTPPVADAGEDQAVSTGDTVNLDGSGSSDADGDPLTYAWVLVAPTGSSATLDDPTSETPSFVADVDGTYALALTVSDGTDTDSDTMSVVASGTANTAPVADAGDDATLTLGDTIDLDGSGSSDADGDALTYRWRVVSAPSDSALGSGDIDDRNAETTTFTPDVAGEYTFQLRVTDGTDTDRDTVTYTVEEDTSNTAPVADAGEDQSIELGESATVDASGSSDADGDSLSYTWTFSSVPADSAITDSDLSSTSDADADFTPDVAGEYELQVTVSDGTDSTTDTVVITVTDANEAPVADAGDDDIVVLGDDIALDGSGSSDPDGDSLTYRWRVNSVPSGSSLGNGAIDDRDAETTTFTPDVAGDYTFRLRVSDGEFRDEDTVTFTVEEEVVGNTPPVADAGDDQAIEVGETATLDGSDSADADGDTLSYSWTFSSVPSGSAITDADLSDSTSDTPDFTPDVAGDYELQLTVSDGSNSDADSVTITVSEANQAPVADAGDDATVTLGDDIDLDGTGSSDPDGDSLTYRWRVVSAPSGSSLGSGDIGDRNAETTTFTPDVAGEYTFQLRVTDGEYTDRDTVTYTVEEADENEAPVADAGDDETYELGDTVDLDGSGSSDPDGDTLTYRWRVVSVPSGSSAGNGDIDDRNAETTTFTPDVAGSYTFRLRVSDGDLTDSDNVTFTIDPGNTPPVADAGDDQTLCGAEEVTLDGSGSSDADGDSLTYTWTFSSVPSSSTLTDLDITDSDTDAPSFTPDVDGTFVLLVTVDDGTDTDTDTVTVSVDSGEVVLALHLDEGSGSTAEDGSGNAYDGTISGTGDWVGARFFSGFDFDGNADIQVADEDDLDLSDDWTIEWWMTTEDAGNDYVYEAIFLKGTSTYNYSAWRYSYNGVDYLYVYGLTTSGSYATIYTEVDSIGDGEWHHYAITHDGSRMTLYEDGQSVDSVSTGAMRTNSEDLYIGTYPTSSFYDFNGAMDEFLIHAESLDATEVEERYDATTQWCTGDEDTDGADVEISDPSDGDTSSTEFVAVTGSCDDESAIVSVDVNGNQAYDLAGDWSEWVAYVALEDGDNDIEATCEDIAGNSSSETIEVSYSEEVCYDEDWGVIWTLDEDDGSDAADLTGNTTDATAYNVDWLIGAAGNAARFDGSSSYIQAPNVDDFNLVDSFTIDFWLRRDGSTSDWECPISRADSGFGAYSFCLNGTTLYLGITNEDEDQIYITYSGITDGDWHHVAGVYDGSDLDLYVDGNLEDSDSLTGPLIDEGVRTYVGAYYYASYYHLEGDVDQVRFREDALTARQVASLVTEGETCLISENYAVYGTAEASSELASAYPADNIIDDDYDEESLSGAATNAWLTSNFSGGYIDITLDDVLGVTMVRWANTHNGASANRATTDYVVYASPTGAFDGEEVELEAGSGVLEDTLAWHTIELDEPVATTVLRFVAEDYDSRGAGINEIQIYGVE